MNDTINQVGAGAPADRLREALAGLLAIVDESRGVSGYHLNGAIAEWDEFPEVEAARATLDDLPECGCCGKTGECDADCDARQAAPAAPEEQQPVAQKILDLILDECKYWHYRDEARRGGFAALYAKAKEVADAAPPAHPDAALVEAANAALKAIQEALEATYHNAYPECCGQGHFECCGSPVQAWDDRDQKIMDLLAPHEEALRAALAGKGGE